MVRIERGLMYYNRFCTGLNDKGRLIGAELLRELLDANPNPEDDQYVSIFEYNDTHYKQFVDTGTVAGITDVTTPKLVFDFDCKDDLEKARKDAVEVIARLNLRAIKNKSISIYFSGSKGFTIEALTNLRINPVQLRQLCIKDFGNGLVTLDSSLYNASRILRLPRTKHQNSGLYKIALSYSDLQTLSIDEIKERAKDLSNSENFKKVPADLANNFLPIITAEQKKPTQTVSQGFLDFTLKPKYLTNCRWSLQNGYFAEGSRDMAFLCLAATYKNQGFHLEHTYRLLKGVAELQATNYKCERFSDEELYNNVITQVYSPTWNGGQFTCREIGWLQTYCQALGHNACKHTSTDLTVKAKDVYKLFEDYAVKYEDNVLYTGITSLDEKSKLMVGTTNTIVGPPGVGKTSLMLQVLSHNSAQNIPAIFFSYDMFHSLMYMRMIQRETGLQQDRIYDIFKHDKKKSLEIQALINQTYKNVEFCFKSGQTIDEITETIRVTQDKIGQKVKLIVIDYNELIITDHISDATASSAYIAQKVRQIANEEEVCSLMLLQPSKLYSRPNEIITSFNSAKGSSSLAQAQTLMLGCSRPGFDPVRPERDKFFNISCLKNRNGGLFNLDFKWDGLRGLISDLTYEESIELEAIRAENEEESEGNNNGGWGRR